MKRLLLSLASGLLLQSSALACGCQLGLPVCNAVAFSNVVFIGTVESISPSFLSNWNLTRRPSLNQLNQANARFLTDQSPQNLAALKDVFHKTFPDLPEDQADRLAKANSQQALIDLFSAVLGHGKRIRFHVRTVFRNGDGDDDDPKSKAKATDAKKDDDDKKDQVFDVWTPFGDCGYDFQTGETYLVYAGTDEETNIMETDACMRTRRLSDAGADLAYLYFYKDEKNPAARLEGFTTYDLLYQVKQAGPHDPDRIDEPAPGLMVELKSDGGSRYTPADAFGKFVFDGLDAGDYQISAYASGFPETVKLLSGPKRFRVQAKGCANQVLLIPKAPK